MRTGLIVGALTLSLAAGGTARAHEFLVYFEAGRTEFLAGPPGPGALWFRQVVADAACYGRQDGVRVVRVTAHADSAGPAELNRSLSQARGEAVADLLVRFGVPRSRILVESRGETQPSVATGDGVSEPLNRRAVIVHEGDIPLGSCTGPTLPRLPAVPR